MRNRTDNFALDYMGLQLSQRALDELQSRCIRNYVEGTKSAYATTVCATVDLLIALGYLQTVQAPDGSTVLAPPKPPA